MCYGEVHILDVHHDGLGVPSVERCIDELRTEGRHKAIRYVIFKDKCFLLHERGWIEALSKEYKKNIGSPFILNIAPQTLDRVKLKALKDAGLSIVVVDIISGREGLCADTFKGRISHSYLILSSQILYDSKVITVYELVVNDPSETEEDRIETISIMVSLKRPFLIHTIPFTSISKGIPSLEETKDRKPEVDDYYRRLLLLTPYIPRFIIHHLNKPAINKKVIHSLLLDLFYLITNLFIKPLFITFMIARSFYSSPLKGFMVFFLLLRWKGMQKLLQTS